MSLILDALHKADRERQTQQEAPSINSIHAIEPDSVPSSGIKPIYFFAAIGVAFTAMVGMYFIGQKTAVIESPKTVFVDDQPSATPLNQTAGKVRTKTPSAESSQAEPISTLSPPVSENRTTLEQQLIAAQYKAAEQETKQSVAAVQLPAEEVAAVNELYQAVEEEAQQPQVAKVEKTRLAPAPKTNSQLQMRQEDVREIKMALDEIREANSQAKEKPFVVEKIEDKPFVVEKIEEAAPFIVEKIEEIKPSRQKQALAAVRAAPKFKTIRDLPESVQTEIPSLFYSEHNFRKNGKSSVTINRSTQRKGSKIGKLVVVAIEQDGVVLRYNKHKFKMQALNSWVNM